MARIVDAIRRTGPIWRREPRRFFLIAQRRRFQGDTITFRRRGFRWTGHPWDVDVTWSVYVFDHYQEPERIELLRWMRRHGHVTPDRNLAIDVGANLGTTSLPLARDEGLQILAIEPDPDNLSLLRRNISQNGLGDRIECVHAAVTKERGEATILLSAHSSGQTEVDAGTPPPYPMRGRERVPSAPLGELLAERGVAPSEVGFVWSDTQGGDGDVLITGAELWRAGVPLYMEFWPGALRRHDVWDAVLDAASYGFDTFLSADSLIGKDHLGVRPVSELAEFAQTLDGHDPDQTDILLIPATHRGV